MSPLPLYLSRWIHPRHSFFLPVKVLRRVFRGKFVAGLRRAFRQGKLGFYGDQKALPNPKLFRALVRSLFLQDWVVSCQAALWRSPICPALPGSLHPSRRHLQPSFAQLPGRPSYFPRARLRPRQQEAEDDPHRRRISAAVPLTRAAQGLCSHPFFRLPRQPASSPTLTSLPATAPGQPGTVFYLPGFTRAAILMVLSPLWWTHANHREAHRGATGAAGS